MVMDGPGYRHGGAPDAEVKVFLTASAEERARRRMLELEERGTPEPYAAILLRPFRNGTGTIPTVTPHPCVRRRTRCAGHIGSDFFQSEDALLHIIRERTGL